jgi:predicted nuclease of predicted toxin-antitoxin system
LKILLDECTPRIVKTRLPQRAISTVQDMGWAGIANGELIARAEQEFDVLVTADQKLPRQQHLAERRLAIIVLPTNQVPEVVKLLPDLERALDTIQPGALIVLALHGS